MKKGIHPKMNPVIFIDESTQEEIFSYSTLTSNETKEVDGITYYVIRADITALSHPFFTGEMRFVDSQGRVDKFMQKLEKAKKLKTKQKTKKKSASSEKETPKSYQEILREQQVKLKQARN